MLCKRIQLPVVFTGFILVGEEPSEKGGTDGDDGDEDHEKQDVKALVEPPGEKAPCCKGEEDEKQVLPSYRRRSGSLVLFVHSVYPLDKYPCFIPFTDCPVNVPHACTVAHLVYRECIFTFRLLSQIFY